MNKNIQKSLRISHSLQHAQDVAISCFKDEIPHISHHINLYFFFLLAFH